MTSLPFVSPPRPKQLRRIGNNAVGVLEFPLLGGLTVGESAMVTELLSLEQSSFVAGAKVADTIAKSEEISLTEAFALIEAAVSGRSLEPAADQIRIRHATAIEQVANIYTRAGQRSMEATVTALICNRLELTDWTVEDTRKMPRQLFNEIWQLAQDEQEAEAAVPEPVTEEELGKQPLASTRPQKPTGR